MTAPLGRTGIYMRLSRDDEKAGESMSIENQRAMLLRYVAENGGTVAGEYADGGLRMAASFLLTFANGAIATVNANYLNPKGNGIWGNERLIVFCTRGSVETDAGARTIRVSTDEGVQVLPWGEGKDYFGMVADHLNGETERPIPEEIEFLPTKTVNLLRERAEEAAK